MIHRSGARKRVARRVLYAIVVDALPGALSAAGDESWQRVAVPEAWKSPPGGGGAASNGYAWFRARARVPAAWRGRAIELFVEPVDDARQVWVDGALVGAAGSLPPRYRSGLGDGGRHALPADRVRPGAIHDVAVRVYRSDGRTDFAVAAPALLALPGETSGVEGIRMEGEWLYRRGDDPSFARAAPEEAASDAEGATPLYEDVERIDDVETWLRRRRGDRDALPPAGSLESFTAAADLVVELVLAEPDIAQPLFFDFDERGRLWVAEYRQYPQPAGLTAVSRDKFLRTVYDRVPRPPPHHERGRDRISIHEDKDGDGAFESHAVFVDGLSIATSFARARGGVFVLNPPYLLFYADRDGDDRPDGDPDVLLEGFGLEDTHSVVNSLRLGPDGWLYAAQGSTVSARVLRPGIDAPDAEPARSMGQLIWRYHPETRRYEVFAEGGGNAFGVEIDAAGRVFSGHNGGDTRGFHYVPGGYLRKGFEKHGSLSNPYAFGFFEPMAHHSVPRFTHTFIIYDSVELPAAYHGRLLGVEPLQGRVVRAEMGRDRSSFRTRDVDRPLSSDDPWFRPVAIVLGTDGAVYVADFHEQRIDHSSHYAGRVAADTGRIWRLRSRAGGPPRPADLSRLDAEALVASLDRPNRSVRREALRLLGDRKDATLVDGLRSELRLARGQAALERLWALAASGGLDGAGGEAAALELLSHPEPQVRLWTARIACDDGETSPAIAARLAAMAREDGSVAVRSQLASCARRLGPQHALPILSGLLARDEDAYDIHVPLLVWWGLEAHCAAARDAVVAIFDDAALWARPLPREHILERLLRRLAAAGGRADLLAAARLLRRAPGEAEARIFLAGFEKAFQGRALGELPAELADAIADSGAGSPALELRRGSPDAVARAIADVADAAVDARRRIETIEILGEIRAPGAASALLRAAVETGAPVDLRRAAIAALRAFDEPSIGVRLAAAAAEWDRDLFDVAAAVLATRQPWARELLAACDARRIDPARVPVEVRRRVLLWDDDAIARGARALWGVDGEGGEGGDGDDADAAATAARERVESVQRALAGGSGNPYGGQRLYRDKCGACHTLFGEGGNLGPDLTSARRDDIDALVRSVALPDAEIREGYENVLVVTTGGQLVNGLVVDDAPDALILRGVEGRNLVIRKDEIAERRALAISLMPGGILDGLEAQDLRDLFAYLRASQPLP